MSAHSILGLAFALTGLLMAITSWSGRDWILDSRKDDQILLWLGEEGARLLDTTLALCFAFGGVMIAFGVG
jgi:hypothetical protein